MSLRHKQCISRYNDVNNFSPQFICGYQLDIPLKSLRETEIRTSTHITPSMSTWNARMDYIHIRQNKSHIRQIVSCRPVLNIDYYEVCSVLVCAK